MAPEYQPTAFGVRVHLAAGDALFREREGHAGRFTSANRDGLVFDHAAAFANDFGLERVGVVRARLQSRRNEGPFGRGRLGHIAVNRQTGVFRQRNHDGGRSVSLHFLFGRRQILRSGQFGARSRNRNRSARGNRSANRSAIAVAGAVATAATAGATATAATAALATAAAIAAAVVEHAHEVVAEVAQAAAVATVATVTPAVATATATASVAAAATAALIVVEEAVEEAVVTAAAAATTTAPTTATTRIADVAAATATARIALIGSLGAAAQSHHQYDAVHLRNPPATKRSQPTQLETNTLAWSLILARATLLGRRG